MWNARGRVAVVGCRCISLALVWFVFYSVVGFFCHVKVKKNVVCKYTLSRNTTEAVDVDCDEMLDFGFSSQSIKKAPCRIQ